MGVLIRPLAVYKRTMWHLVSQGLFDQSWQSWIYSLLAFFAFFVIWALFGQRINNAFYLWEINKAVRKLDRMRKYARDTSLKVLKSFKGVPEDVEERLDRLLEYFVIEPVSADPVGIMYKLEHLMDVREARFLDEVKRMVPSAEEGEIKNMSMMLEAALALNQIYRVVRHYYILSKKTNSILLTYQLYMLLPIIMIQAKSYMGAFVAFLNHQPIGDGAGALLAAKLMRGHKVEEIAKDTVVAEVPFQNRRLFVVKAKGPEGNVGKPGEAIKRIIERLAGNVSLVIMVDAGMKLEGEKTGDVSEGVGAAIGGIGVDKYKIEEIATKKKVPVYAMIIKESLRDALTPMREEIVKGVEKALEKLKRIILENTKENDNVIVAGVGNTLGIGQ